MSKIREIIIQNKLDLNKKHTLRANLDIKKIPKTYFLQTLVILLSNCAKLKRRPKRLRDLCEGVISELMHVLT